MAAVPSVANTEMLSMVHGVKSRSVLQLIFDCSDHAANYINLNSSPSTTVSSFLLSAPRYPAHPIWCCNEKDQVASVLQDISDNSFTVSAYFVAPGNNFVVPAILSAGTHIFEFDFRQSLQSESDFIFIRRNHRHFLQC